MVYGIELKKTVLVNSEDGFFIDKFLNIKADENGTALKSGIVQTGIRA